MTLLFLFATYLASFILSWRWLAIRLKQEGHGRLSSHLSGASVGTICCAWVILLSMKLNLIGSTKAKTPQLSSAATANAETSLPPSTSAPTNTEHNQPVATLDYTYKQYAERLSAELIRLNNRYSIHNTELTQGPVSNTWSAQLSDQFRVFATLEKSSDKVLKITAIAGTDGTATSDLELIALAACVLTAAINNVPYRTVLKEIPDLIDDRQRTRGNVRLSAKAVDKVGVRFTISPR